METDIPKLVRECLGNNVPSKNFNRFAPAQEEPIIVTAHEIEVLQIDQITFIDEIGDYPESQNLHPGACRTELEFRVLMMLARFPKHKL